MKDFAIRLLASMCIILLMVTITTFAFFSGVRRERTRWAYVTTLADKSIVYRAGKGQTWANIAATVYPFCDREAVVAILEMLNGEKSPSGRCVILPREF